MKQEEWLLNFNNDHSQDNIHIRSSLHVVRTRKVLGIFHKFFPRIDYNWYVGKLILYKFKILFDSSVAFFQQEVVYHKTKKSSLELGIYWSCTSTILISSKRKSTSSKWLIADQFIWCERVYELLLTVLIAHVFFI